MKRRGTMRTRIGVCVLVLAIGAALAGPGPGEAADCTKYLELIEKMMPREVGTEDLLGLLKVEPIDWSAKLEPSTLFLSLGEEKPTIKALRGYSNIGLIRSGENTSKMKFNLVRGEIKYVNQTRGFSPKSPTAFDPEKAKTRVLDLVGNLGLPESEADLEGLSSNILRGRAAPPKSLRWVRDYDIETHFFLPRVVNKIPVLSSLLTVGVSNDGAISMFRARWPILQIDPALANAKVIEKSAVARAVHDRLVQEQGCLGSTHFNMFLAYVPSKLDVPDKDDKIPEVAKQIVYTPKLIVVFMPSEGRSVRAAGSQLEFDLLGS
jgi:hypothetical protein